MEGQFAQVRIGSKNLFPGRTNLKQKLQQVGTAIVAKYDLEGWMATVEPRSFKRRRKSQGNSLNGLSW